MSTLLSVTSGSFASPLAPVPVPAPIPTPSPALQPGPTASPTALAIHEHHTFHEHHDIILGSPSLKSGSTVSTNNAQTIWVQDQPFVDWTSAWTWVRSLECETTCKACSIDLVRQKIKMENTFAKSSKQVDKLIKQDWAHMK